jgi:hypothetical protein
MSENVDLEGLKALMIAYQDACLEQPKPTQRLWLQRYGTFSEDIHSP